MNRFVLFILAVMVPGVLLAQRAARDKTEELVYDINYKYGLVMLRGGSVNYKLSEEFFMGEPVYKAALDFRTSSFFDKIYRMRDTLTSYTHRVDNRPIYHIKSLNEGSKSYTEEIHTRRFGLAYSEVRTVHTKGEEIPFDSILSVHSPGFDMISILTYLRKLDVSDMPNGFSFPACVFSGRKSVPMLIRYEGKEEFIYNSESTFQTIRFALDITDETFNESKNAINIWMTDDTNRLPLKVKGKLKIGAAEAILRSYKNLFYPLTSAVCVTAE